MPDLIAAPDAAHPDEDVLEDLCAGIRRFLEVEVVRRHRDLPLGSGNPYGPDGRFREDVLAAVGEVRMAASAAGFYALFAPVDVGGGGLGYEALFRVWEAVYSFCGGEFFLGHHMVSHWSRGVSHLHSHADPAFRDEIVPGLVSGRTTTCFALSEPDAGSDIWRMQTTAARVDDGWVINGSKQWITNSPYADWITVFAVTDRERFAGHRSGLTAFIVPADAPGFRVDSVIPMFGQAGGDEAILSFTDVFVPDRQVLGEPHEGLALAMSGVSLGRLYNAGRAVGLGRWALRKALVYATDRVTFGKPLIENQSIAFPLADLTTALHAAWLVGLDAARRLDRGEPARAVVSMAKLFATDTAFQALDHAIQIHGALGFTNELHLTGPWHSLRRTRVADGSAEMLRTHILKEIRRDGIEF
jgi:acyl-CoA dehydrogenase